MPHIPLAAGRAYSDPSGRQLYLSGLLLRERWGWGRGGEGKGRGNCKREGGEEGVEGGIWPT